jgi:hypothetical protein
MQGSTAYGKRFGEALRLQATAFVSRSLQNSIIAVTELRSDNPEHGISARLVREDAYLVGYNIVDYPIHEYFEDERATPITALRAGQTTLYDVNRDPRFNINKSIHCVHFYFPRAGLNAGRSNAPKKSWRPILRATYHWRTSQPIAACRSVILPERSGSQ